MLGGDISPMLFSIMTGQLGNIELVRPRPDESFGEAVAAGGVDVLLMRAEAVADVEALLGDIARAAPIGVVAISHNGESGRAYRVDSQPVTVSADGKLDLASAITLAAGQAAKVLH